MPLLTNDSWRKILTAELGAVCQAERFGLVAFVFMPEHVHLLVLPLEAACRVSRLLGRTKRQSSQAIKQILEQHRSPLVTKMTVQERPGRQSFRFWQEGGGFDRNLFSPKAIEASIDYIHENPVKRGLCQRATDWKWSSARFYSSGTIDHDLPTLMRPDPSWFHLAGARQENA